MDRKGKHLDAKDLELLRSIIDMIENKPEISPEKINKTRVRKGFPEVTNISELYEIARKMLILEDSRKKSVQEAAGIHGINESGVREILEEIRDRGLPVPWVRSLQGAARRILEGLEKVHTRSVEEIKAGMPARAPKEPEVKYPLPVKTKPPEPRKGKKPVSPAQEEKNKIAADAIKKLERILDVYVEHEWQAEENIRDAIEDAKKVVARKESLELHLHRIKGKFNPFEVLHILYSAKKGISDPMTRLKISQLLREKVADWRKSGKAFRILEGALEKKEGELEKLRSELKEQRLGPLELVLLLKQINESEPFSKFGINERRGAVELKRIIARNVCRWEFDRMRKLGIPYIAMGKSVGATLFENSTVSEIMNEDENKDMKKIKGSEILLKLINAKIRPDTLPLPEPLYHKNNYIVHKPTLESKLKEWIPKPSEQRKI